MDAIACCEPLAAESVLRTKAQAGDPEPEVTAACLLALLRLDPEPCAAFVGTFLDSEDAVLRESAALALGESRLPEALAELRRHWDAAPYKGAAAQVLLKGAVLHRSEAAFDWLLALVADGEHRIAERLVRDLAVYRGNTRLRQRLAEALAARGDEDLLALLTRAWPAGPE
jgi:HEAT repeat protein